MAVYQPSAIVGNSRTLVTIGSRGEMMAFFYPHIDFPQNLHQGMPAVYFGQPGKGSFQWTFESGWHGSQHYLPRRNILVTELIQPEWGLALTITDLVHPTRDLFGRRFLVRNQARQAAAVQLLQYLDFSLGEVEGRNSVRWVAEHAALIQYWRDICFAIGGSAGAPFDQYQCGKEGGTNSAKSDMADGMLAGQQEEIGSVDLAVGWSLTLAPGQQVERELYISAAHNENSAVTQLQAIRSQQWEGLLRRTAGYWDRWAARARPMKVPADLAETYHRSLLATKLLFDEHCGSFLAAPEFDPEFERSGGYGYCWPRDASEVAGAMEQAGYPELAETFFHWLARVQRPEGYWDQRYWLSGERGPSWALLLQTLQIDQTASSVCGLCRHYQRLDKTEQTIFLQTYRRTLLRAGDYLADCVEETGLHSPASDLWETFRGRFTYTTAAIRGALREAALLASRMGAAGQADRWRAAADRAKGALLERLWTGRCFAQRVAENGRLDTRVDSSIIGVLDPFQALSLEEEREREMIESSLECIEQRLGIRLAGRTAIRRFEGDRYIEGSAGAVNTLWLARALLMLAEFYRKRNPGLARERLSRALEYIRLVVSQALPTGLLPELIGREKWAAPHGWAMALYLTNMAMLDKLAAAGLTPEEKETTSAIES